MLLYDLSRVDMLAVWTDWISIAGFFRYAKATGARDGRAPKELKQAGTGAPVWLL